MPIRVVCPSCNQQYAAPDHLAGQSVACTYCGSQILVGSFDALMASGPPDPQGPHAPEPPRQNRRGLVLAIVGGLLAICGLCVCGSVYSVISSIRRGIQETADAGNGPQEVGTSSPNRQPTARSTTIPSTTGATRSSANQTNRSTNPATLTPESTRLPRIGKADAPADVLSDPIAVGKADQRVVIVESRPPLAYVLIGNIRDSEVRAYDLSDGNLTRSATVDDVGSLLAGSPDGWRAAVAKERSRTRKIKVVRLQDPPVVETTCVMDPPTYFRWAWFATPDRLLTCSDKGQLRMWQLPEGKVVYDSPVPYREGAPVLTPDKKYLLDSDEQTVRFVEVSSGKYAAAVAVDVASPDARLSDLAISPDGETLCAFVQFMSVQGRMLGGWNLKTGKRQFLTDMPPSARSPRWLGSDYLLAGESLFSLQKQQFVCRLPGFRPIHVRSDGNSWMRSQYGNDQVLSLLKVPDDALQTKITREAAGAKPFAKAGDAISLQIDMQVQPPASERGFRSKLETLLRQQLAAGGYRVASGQPRTLRVVVSQRDTGNVVSFEEYEQRTNPGFRGQRRTGKVRTVPDVAIVATVDLIDANGKSYASFKRERSPNHEYGTIDITPLTDMATMLMNRRWQGLIDLLRQSLRFKPEYVAFDLPESRISVRLDPEWTAARTAQSQRRRQAEYDRDRKKTMLPDRRVRAAWEVDAYAVPSADASLLRRPAKLGRGSVHEIKFSFPNVGQAAIRFQNQNGESFIDRYDLKTSKRFSRLPLPEPSRLADFRPDGKFFVLIPESGRTNVQIGQCKGNQDQLILTIDVSSKMTNVQQAALVASNRLLTIGSGKACVWELPSKKLLYERSVNVDHCELSWGRRYFLDLEPSRVVVLRTFDGTTAGELELLGGEDESLRAASFRRDGKALAAITGGRSRSSGKLNIWSLTDGSVQTHLHSQHLGDAIRWCGPGYLLTKNKLFDVATETPVWDYPPFPIESPDGRAWMVIPDRQGVQHLAALALPSKQVAEAMDTAMAKAEKLLAANDAVRLDIKLPSRTADSAELTQRLRDVLTRKLNETNFRVDDNAEIVLTVHWGGVSSVARSTPFGFENGDQVFTMPDQTYVTSLHLRKGDAQGFWSKSVSVYLPKVDYQVNWTAVDPQEDLARQLDERMLERLERLSLPSLILKNSRSTIGRSTIDANGERAQVSGFFR